MSEWKARRFWTTAEVAEQGDGYSVLLDGREVRTPAKAALWPRKSRLNGKRRKARSSRFRCHIPARRTLRSTR